MATISEDYVSFETAKLLKEKGFDVYGDGSFGSEIKIWMEYSPFGKIRDISSSRPSIKGYPAPTLQMAMKWLREVHNIHIIAEPCLGEGNEPNLSFNRWFWTILKEEGEYKPIRKIDEFTNYEQACEAAIKYCLENLI